MELRNAREWPKIKTAKFLTAGLVSYKDVDAGIALLKNETINTALTSFAGKPVIIDHAEVSPSNYEKFRKGNVIACRFNAQDGWYYVDFIVDDDQAIDCIENKGYSVSCAYNVLDVGDGGLYQDIPYDGEITKISFTHLALVTEPRYEESKILDEMPLMMVNSKGTLIPAHNISNQEEQKMFKLFQKNKEGEQKEVSAFVLVNGKQVSIDDLLTAYNDKGDMDKKEMYQAKDDDIVDIAGHKVSIGEMKNAYMKMNEKSEADEKMKKEGMEDKKNEKDEEKKKATAEDNGEDKKGKPEESIEDEEERATKKNSKEKTADFFLQLEKAENSKDIAQGEQTASPRFGLTRSERANTWRDNVKNNIAAR